jgi:hypothetical protein
VSSSTTIGCLGRVLSGTTTRTTEATNIYLFKKTILISAAASNNVVVLYNTRGAVVPVQVQVRVLHLESYSYSGFRFDPNISPSEFYARLGPKSQAGSGTGRLGLPTKYQQPLSERKSESNFVQGA